MRRAGTAILAAAATFAAPAAAWAQQSAGCAQVNAGALNFSAVYSNGVLDGAQSTARYERTGSAPYSAIHAIRAVAGTTDPEAGTTAYFSGGTVYPFTAGDVINLTMTVTNYGAGTLTGTFRNGSGSSTTAESGNNAFTANGTATRTYTIAGGETSIGLRAFRTGTTASGTIAFSLTCTPVPMAQIASISPNTVQAGIAPGSVTISGSNFSASGNTVTFTDPATGATTNAAISAESATSITVTGPTFQNAGPSTVRVTTANGQTDTELFNYRPGVTGVAGNGGPNGPPGGGNSVVLTGVGFSGATAVNFGATPAASFTVNTNTQITAVAPAGSGSVNITATARGVTSTNTATYNYVQPAPTVASISPTGGSTGGGTLVTITGTNFVSGDSYTASFGATTVPATFVNTGGLTATAPAGTGTVAVTVIDTTTSQAGTGSADYTYAAPTVSALSRRVGPAGQPQPSLVITGTNFTPAATVAVGGTDAGAGNVVVNSATQITVTLPAKAPGQYDVIVTTGAVSTAATAASRYTYYPAPTITGISPANGSTAGNTRVTITGTNLLPANGTPNITFGGQAAGVNSGDSQSATSVVVSTPARGTAGAVQVQATTEGGVATAGSNFTYAGAPAAPVVTAPANGATLNANQPVVTGTAAANSVVTVFIDGVVRGTGSADTGGTFSIPSTASLSDGSHTVRANARPAADSDAVSPSSATNTFTVDTTPPAAPVITAPANGATTTSQTPIVTGTAEANGTVTVSFDTGTGGGATTATAGGSWSFTPTAALAYGTRTVTATVRDAAGNVSPAATRTFNIVQAPAITSLSPAQGTTAGGQSITITGSGFASVDPATGVTVGGTPATGVTVTATQITATTPAGTAGATSVQVANAAGSASTGYTYLTPPTANAQAVTVAYQTATAITLTGTNATGYAYTQPANGTVTGTGPNVTFTPAAGYSGTTSFTFTTTNGSGAGALQSAPATVTVTVNPARPSATGQPADRTVAVGATASFTATASGNPTVQWESSADGGGSYTPIAGATASTYSFTASAADSGNRYRAVFTNAGGTTASNAAVLTVVQAPTANNQSVTAPFNTATAITLTGSDPQGRTLTYTVATGPARGTLSGTAPNLTYTPTANYVGTDSFTFTVSNGVVTSSPGTVSITVGKGSQTVSFTSTAPTGATVGGATYTVSATASSGLPVSLASVTTGVCTLSGSTVSFVGAGTCTISAGQAGNATYDPAPPAQQSFAVAAPTITIAPPSAPSGTAGVAYSQTYSANGGTGPYTYTVTGTLPAGMTFAGGRLSGTPTQVGTFTYTVTAQDASPSGPYAGSRSYSLTINAPTIVVLPASIPDPQVGVAYSQVLSTANGVAPYSYAVTAGALPPGLTLANGTLSGTPTRSGTASFTITSTDSSTGTGAPFSGSRSYTVTVAAPTVAITPTTLPGATGGQAYSQTLTAGGGTAPYTFTTAGPLPAGLSLSSSGTLAGTPTQSGSFTFDVVATDSSTGSAQPGGRYSATQRYTLAVAAPTIAIAPATLPNGTVAASYAQALTATGGAGGYSYAIAAGALPAGLTLANGTLSGTPTAGGTFTFTVRATDGSGFSGTRTYSLAIGAPTVTVAPGSVPDATRGAGYSQQLTAAGGTGPYSYAVTAGALPAGVTLSNAGLLSGTPTAAGSYTFTVTARDSSTGAGPYGGSTSYTLVVAVPTITLAPETLPGGTTRIAYSQALTASGGTAPYGYAVTAGALPAGFTLSTGGTLAGSTTTAGSFGVTVTATDANGNTGARSYTLAIAAPAIALAPTTIPAATTRTAYSQALSATGGTAPYAYAVTAGALPSGITLSTAGALSGTATAAGSFTFTVRATDANGNGGSQSYTLQVNAPAITLAPASLPGATAGSAFSQAITASGGTGGYAYAVTAGALPAGLSLAADGTLAGTPTAGGSFGFTITATDGNGNAGARTYTLTVAAAQITVAPEALPAATTRIAYSQRVTASGGTSPYSYAVTAGALPAGLTLGSSGTLAGTPTVAGSYTFTVTATDSSTGNGPFAGSRSYTLAVAAPAIAIAPTTLPAATTRVAYSQALTASGGRAPYGFAVTAGALPAGVTLSSAGVLSGSATTAGSFTFTVTATDADGNGGAQGYTLVVAAPAITLAPATLPDATTRIAYSQAITATGGAGSYAYAVTAGALPAGITLSAGGTLSGTATTAGSFTFTVTVTDANGNAGARGYTLAVTAPAIALAPQTLAAARIGETYTAALTATGGTAPYGFAITAGALPAGVTLAQGGALSGTPTAGGDFTFTARATDANGNAATRSYTLTVAAAQVVVAPATLPAGQVRVAYSQALTATGGTAPYGYAVTAGALPAGITLAANGTLSGTPTQGGSFTVTVTATDSSTGAGPFTGSRTYTLAIGAPALALTPETLPATVRGAAYSQTLTTTGGTAPYSYAATGTLPPGLTLSTAGVLSGRATTVGSYAFTVTATDATTAGNGGPYSVARSYTVDVTAPTIALAPDALPAATTRVAYSQAITATGGAGSYTYAVTQGALPAGITLSTEGTLAGSATAAGSFTLTIAATDANGNAGSRAYTLVVTAPAIAIAPTTLPAATTRVAYGQALAASGGVAPYTYAVTAGALPPGIILSGATLSGTPSAAGSFGFTVTASDANGNTAAQSYTLTVTAPTIALAPQMLPGGTFNAAYAADLSATGGTAPYAYAVTAGALPGGVTLSSAGRLAGTPTAAGQSGFTVTATDANGNAGAQAYTVAIAQASQTISFANPGAKSLSDSPVTLAATASSGLAVGFVSTTDGVCTVQGNALTLVRTGTCTVEARQPGNGDVAAAAPVAQSFAVTAARLVATAAQASVSGQVGTALAPVTPVTVAGGTAPFAYALSGGTLPAGLAFAESTGTLSGTPTGGQAATAYTVTVRDAGGQSASAGFTLTVAAPMLALGQTTLPDGAFQAAYSQQLSVTGGTAPYRFAVTAGALPAGVTLSAGGLVSGTPTAFGRFQVTITATDSSTGTGPYSVAQAYTLTIAPPAAPTAGDAAATVAYGSTDNVVAPTLGGEVTSLAIVGQPSHGSARVDGRTLVYTPAAGYAGPDRFTYTASNAGGTSAPGTVSVTVSAPAVAITPASLPDARQDVAYSQQLSAAGGAAPYAFGIASGTLPAGLSLSPAGLLSGTPTAGGTATFAVRATDSSTGAGPFGANQSYTLTVAVAAAPSVRPVPTVNAPGSSTAASTPTSIVLSDFVSGNYTSIQVVTPPQNGSVTLATSGAQTTATYTPRPNFAGTDSFGFVAVGPGGRSPVTSIALSVTGTAPVVAPLTATAMQGTPVTVNLTATATGGPFTAAAVTGISPAGSVTAQLVEGGTAGARTYSLTLLPSLSFTGTATVTYTLSNQFGASAPGTVTLSVTGRPDPSSDATVNGVSVAQADATRRFARAQTDNFFRRNEQLHNGGSGTGGRDMGVGFSVAELGGAMSSGLGVAADVNDLANLKNDHMQAVLGAELASGAVTIARGGMNGVAGTRGRQVLQQGPGGVAAGRNALGQATGEGTGGDTPADVDGGRRTGSVGIWSGGAVTVGAWDKDADRAKVTLTTSGLSAGADIKLSDNLVVGAGGGYGGDLSRIGGGKARIRGRSWSVAGYGSWAPTDGLFVDGIFGGGALDFDTRREVAQTGAIATGSRDGRMLFGSLAAGLDRRGTVDLSAYGRVDYLSARLDRYSEVGGGIYGLTYGRRELESVASVLGLRVAYPMPGWTPRVRGEWRHEFADTDAQLIDYADVANLRYSTRGDFWIRDAFTIDVGAEFGLGRGWGLTTEVGATGGSGATAGTARIGLRKEF